MTVMVNTLLVDGLVPRLPLKKYCVWEYYTHQHVGIHATHMYMYMYMQFVSWCNDMTCPLWPIYLWVIYLKRQACIKPNTCVDY